MSGSAKGWSELPSSVSSRKQSRVSTPTVLSGSNAANRRDEDALSAGYAWQKVLEANLTGNARLGLELEAGGLDEAAVAGGERRALADDEDVVALLAAHQADYVGNLEYSLTAHNFNPVMAMAAGVVIAEPENIVPVGVISPDCVKTPGVLVDHLLARAA